MNEAQQGRHQKLVDVMDRLGLNAIVLRSPANFAWFTGGADNRVDHSSPSGVAAIVALRDRAVVLTDSVEAPRLQAEETPDIEVVDYPWYEDGEPVLRELTGAGTVGVDLANNRDLEVSSEVQTLRLVLDPDAIHRYRAVGRAAVSAVHDVAQSLKSGVSEWEAAGRLLEACLARGLYVPVVMAAGDGRVANFRHPIPQEATCAQRVMLVVCAEGGGLYANYTQFAHFTEPDAEWIRRRAACESILQRMREEATRPGRTLSEAFDDCRRFYAEEGFPDEWTRHHQGGMTGYATREIVARPHTDTVIEIGQAFAWNPSITGAKAEDTFILTDSGPQVIAGDTTAVNLQE